MSLAADIAGDYAIFDGTQNVTLTQRRSGVVKAPTIVSALREPVTKRHIDALGGVALTGRETVWNLNATNVGSPGVAQDDQIADGTDTWVVLQADLKTLGNRWECIARREP